MIKTKVSIVDGRLLVDPSGDLEGCKSLGFARDQRDSNRQAHV
jgi:hypothetical protein